MSQPDVHSNRPSPRSLRLAAIIFVVLAVCIVGYGVVSRAAQNSSLHDLTEEQALPTVAVVKPSKVENESGLELPGRLQAFIRAPIYARVPGYLKSWKHDIGDKVKAGDLLAEIDTPDLDQQLLQARANLTVSQANANFAKTTADRWKSLAGTDAVAKQDVETRTSTYDAQEAQVKASKAAVDQLVAEEGFKRLVVPFDGVVTARETDIGALINVGASGGAELFVVSATDKLRMYVSVPQNFVPSVPSGTKATITVPEHPGTSYSGVVDSSSQAVDPSTGTTLMQVIVDNKAGELMPGGYASVNLHSSGVANVVSVPSSALIFDAKGLSMATLDANNRVVIKPVKIERDLGAVIEIASGLTVDDRVIQNPPDGIDNGAAVRLAATPAGGADAGKPKNKNEKG